MSVETRAEITQLLRDVRAGHKEAHERLASVVYAELRRIASRQMTSERPGHTLQPTALVNEAFLRLLQNADLGFQNRVHFFAFAGTLMRNILVDHARTRTAAKRGGVREKVLLEDVFATAVMRYDHVLDLDSALRKLATLNERQARVVELRYFAGLTTEEIAEVIGVSDRTVKRYWDVARAWLAAELSPGKSR